MTVSRRNTLVLIYIVVLCITFVLFVALLMAEAYVRWTMNQNFSFLGGSGLQSLAVLLFSQFAGLAYLLKTDS